MTPQELKNSILQRAIQGKLVEQRPEEGTGEELYQAIQAEKRRLIKEKKLKKEKPLPEIKKEEIPFDIPDSWRWVRLGFCSNYACPKEKITSKDIKSNMWSLDLEDIEKETGRIICFRSVKDRQINGDKVLFYKGQILYSKLRPYLKKILIAPKNGICTPELVPFSVYGDIVQDYIAYFLKTPYVDHCINSSTYGIKMPRVGTETMINLLIPLPPLAEQRRIVAKIEELLPYIDRYAAAWSRLETLNRRFPADMRKSLLQMAIQGKLVEQRPEEGSGEELYQRIQAEKRRLIKEKKIKKEKPLPEIKGEEIPFDIPTSWKWVRISELGLIVGGGTPKTENAVYWDEQGIPWITPADMKFITSKYVERGERNISNIGLEKSSAKLMPKGTVLYSSRAPIGYVAIAANDISTNQGFKSLVPVIVHINEYVYYCLIARTRDIISRASGTTFKEISGTDFGLTLVPLPPLAEQRRIVAKLQELLPLCERLAHSGNV